MNDIISDLGALCDQIQVEHAAVVNLLGKQTILPLLQADLRPKFRINRHLFFYRPQNWRFWSQESPLHNESN